MASIGSIGQETKTDDEPVEVEITDRNGEPYTGKSGPTVFLVVGEYSQQYRKAERSMNDRILKDARRGIEHDAEDAEELGAERIAAGIVGWRNVEDADGKEIPFTKKNVVALLQQAPWVAAKVSRVIKAHSSFFARNSGS